MNFGRLRTLGRLEWGAFFASLVLLPWCTARLRVRGFRSVLDAVGDFDNGAGTEDLDTARRIARGVGLAARYGLCRANCLKRSLVLVSLLRRRGIACTLKMGTRMNGQKLTAHAWVEQNGVVINDRPDVARGFEPLSRLERERLVAGGEHTVAIE